MLPKPESVFSHQPPKSFLFGPGPCNIDPRVAQALGTDLVGHLDPYFVQVMKKSQELIRWVWQTENEDTVTVSGTGTSAMEAAVANLVVPGESVLVCICGYFGARMAEIARRYGGVVHELRKTWGEVFTVEEISDAIAEYRPKVLGIVHGETSTGAYQPLEGVGDLCHDNDCLLLVDSVTTLGGAPLLIDAWGVDAAYSCSQKCLGCSPGASPLTFSPRAMEKINARDDLPSTFYFDIKLLNQYWGERKYHHTAPISMNYGLYEALVMIYEEGLEERWERHSRVGRLFAEGIEAMGLSLKIKNPSHRMPQLTTVEIPEGVNGGDVIKALSDKHSIFISGGLGELAGKIWRVGLMGYNATEENVNFLLDSFKDVLSTLYPEKYQF